MGNFIESIKRLKDIYDIASKPKWEEVKKIVYITILFFALVSIVAFAVLIFINLQFSSLLCQYMP